MADTFFDPESVASELASECLRDDPDRYYRVFEFDDSRFPLEPGEIIQVTYRRIRPPQHPVVLEDALVFEGAGVA